jgi:hypothetical protein
MAIELDVLASGAIVGRIFKANVAPIGAPCIWMLAFRYHEDPTPTHGYELDARGRHGGVRQELATGVT